MIKAIIFDMGGVVVSDPMNLIYEETGRKFNTNPMIVRKKSRPLRIKWMKNEISAEEFWKNLASRLGISDVNSLKNVWKETFVKNVTPNKKTIQIIKRLKDHGYKVALLSNTVKPHANYHMEKKHFDLFSTVFLSYKLRMKKPEKKIYRYVIRKMGVKFEECVFIDDRGKNLEPAKELGMKTILFQSSEQLEKELKKLL